MGLSALGRQRKIYIGFTVFLPAIRETWVQSLGQKGPLEKGMTTYSRILAWRIPWTEDPSRLQSVGSQRFTQDWAINTVFLVVAIWQAEQATMFCLLLVLKSFGLVACGILSCLTRYGTHTPCIGISES